MPRNLIMKKKMNSILSLPSLFSYLFLLLFTSTLLSIYLMQLFLIYQFCSIFISCHDFIPAHWSFSFSIALALACFSVLVNFLLSLIISFPLSSPSWIFFVSNWHSLTDLLYLFHGSVFLSVLFTVFSRVLLCECMNVPVFLFVSLYPWRLSLYINIVVAHA